MPKNRTSSSASYITANALACFGYMSVSLQWLWALVVIGLPYLSASGFENILLTSQGEPYTPPPPIELSGGVRSVITVISVIFAVCVLVYTLYLIPRSIGRFGRRITKTTAATGTQQIVRMRKRAHHPLTKKRQKRIREYLTWSVKGALIAGPLAVCYLPSISGPYELPSQDIIQTVAILSACASVVWFGVQWLVVSFAHIPDDEVW